MSSTARAAALSEPKAMLRELRALHRPFVMIGRPAMRSGFAGAGALHQRPLTGLTGLATASTGAT